MKCGNWDWGRAVPFLGTHKWNFRCSVCFLPTRRGGSTWRWMVILSSPTSFLAVQRYCPLSDTWKIGHLHHRVHTEWRLPISGVHPFMMKNKLWLVRVGCTPTPFKPFTITYKKQSCTLYGLPLMSHWLLPHPPPPNTGRTSVFSTLQDTKK